jgi:hypothetical protein
MKYMLAFFLCMIACTTAALAQYGVSNQRDMYGNIVRDPGAAPARGVNQGPTNNGPINSAPAQPPTGNSRINRGATK